MAKKYVPAGVFLTCDKGTLPATLNVTFNAFTTINGQNLATDLDMVPVANIPPMGVCSMTKMPCVFVPTTPWSPVKSDVQLGMGHPLLEDSKLQCGMLGRIGIHFSMAAAQAACAPPPAPEKSLADQADDYLKTLGPVGAYGRFQLGVAEGLWEGGKGLAEGLWGMAKGGWNAVTHPVDTANAIAEGATTAYKWAGDSENWANAANSAKQGASNAAAWAGNGENWQKVGDKLQNTSPREWGNVVGQVAFEVGLTAATAGAGTALNAAAKTSRVARMALRAARIADVEGHAMSLAGRAARSAAGRMKMLGKVLTGAKKARKAEKAAVKAGKRAKKLRALENCAGPKKCTRVGHPVDVAAGLVFTEAVDFELPGPIPFVWERIWYSRSTHQGALGHGWHHRYDLALAVEEDGTLGLRMADGRLAVFAAPVGEAGSFNRQEKLEAFGNAAQGYRIWNKDERLWYVFAAQTLHEVHLLQAVEDQNGFAIRFAYTPQGFLHTITDSAGRQLRADTDRHGRIVALHAPLPEPGAEGSFVAVRYEYAEAGDLVRTTDALDHAMSFAYAHHLLVRETNRVGLNFYFTYDGTGPEARCLRTWGDGGIYDTTLRYESAEQTVVTDSVGYTKHYTHRNGLVVVVLDSLGAVRQWTYNDDTDLTLERDALGQATSYEYDAHGNQTLVTYPTGARVATHYNGQDLPEQITDANNGVWLWRYDKKGNLVSRTDPAGATSHYTYNSQGRLIDLTDAAEQITYLRYDGQQNISHVMTPSGQISSYQYDQLGRLTHLTDARGDVRRRHYDALGQLLAVREADGTERVFAYDGESNVLRAKDAKRTVEFHYAGLNQLVTRTEAGLQVDFAYNTEGQLMSLQNEQGERYQFELDAAGQVVTEIGFDGLTRRYQRDAAGRVTEIQRAGGRFTRYNYDAVGRVLAVVHNDEAPITYAYGPNGALREARTAGSTVVLERDVLGRVLVETQGAHTVSSTYNQRGQRLQLHSSLGAELALERNDLGDITQAQAGSWFSRIERDEQGLELQRTLSGGVQQRWHRDGRGRPTSQHITAGGTTLRRRQYHWQGLDQLTQIDDSLLGATTYSYDVLSNLTGARYADGAEELRQPDAVGNLFRTLARTDRKYNKGGQLREANGTRYRYDEEGNLVRKTLPDGQQWHYRWDGAGQLTSVTRPDGYAVAFAYDALGRRISKRFRGKITRWVWDGNKPLHEWQELEVGPGAGSVADLTTWLFEEGSFAPMAKLTARGSYSVLTDHLGTPLELYDQAGAKTWQAQLDSYGQVRAGKGKPQDCPFRYQGQYEDTETGLYYNRFRYYDPEAGRYISQDPTRLAGGNSLYGYVRNPTSWLDVLGWMPWPNPTRQGHHLVYQNKASGVPGLEHFADANTPTYFFNEPYVPGSHEAIHAAQRPYVGPRQGAWTGSADELLEASGKGLSHPSISNIRGELREIGSGKVHASNVTPDEAFQKLMEWHKSKSTGSCPP